MQMPRDRTGDSPKWETAEPYWDDHYAGWDTWRTVFPLLALIQPDKVAGNIRSFADRFRHNGFVSDTFVAGNDMRLQQGGDNVDNIIADGFAKGVPGVDWSAAYAVMQHNADEERLGFIGFGNGPPPDNDLTRSYKRNGWIPAEAKMSCSYTLEYALNDACAARVASGLGRGADAEAYARRARSWESLWNPGSESDGFSGWISPRRADGTWQADDPKKAHGSWEDVFYEGNGWTYSFLVPQDFAALIERMGGRERFVARLDHGAANGLIDYSNEPGFLALRAFHYALRPDRCSYWVRDVMTRRYSLNGYPGNEDSGAMGSWYVFSALGFFPNAGQDVYLINGPLFPKATLTLGNGNTFVIEGVNAAAANPFVQTCELNGAPLQNAWLSHAEIAGGGTLHCVMGPVASRFGQDGAPPPSLSTHGVGRARPGRP
jgi:predicted alpha-1,2-mannosidase